MQNAKRNKTVVTMTIVICLSICLLWGAIFFVRNVKHLLNPPDDTSDEISEDVLPTPDAMTALMTCVEQVEQSGAFSSVTEGFGDTRVMLFSYRHSIHNKRFVQGDSSYHFDIAFGSLLKYGVERYICDGKFLVRGGAVHSLQNINWDSQPASVSKHLYQNAFGDVGRSLSHYWITEETVLSSSLVSRTDDTFTFAYELSPELAGEMYAKSLMSFGVLEEPPTFQTIKMTVTFDAALYPLTVKYHEIYTIELPLLGETVCQNEYTETFSPFGHEVVIPMRDYYSSYLSLSVSDKLPRLSNGYQLLLSLFEDGYAYETMLLLNNQEYRFDLSVDSAVAAIYLENKNMMAMHKGGQYYFSYYNTAVYADAAEVNRYIAPIVMPASSYARDGKSVFSDLLSSASVSTNDGKLVIESSDLTNSLYLCIDIATMSLLEARFDFGIEIYLTKTSRMSHLPSTDHFVDVTESISSLAFLTSALDGNVHKIDVDLVGEFEYHGSASVLYDGQLTFSMVSMSDGFPVNLYYADREVSVVIGDTAILGSLDDCFNLLMLFKADRLATVAIDQTPYLPEINFEKDRITIGFFGDVSYRVTLTSSSVSFLYNETEVKLSDIVVSDDNVEGMPKTKNTLLARDLSAFLSDTCYPSMLFANSIGGKLDVSIFDNSHTWDIAVALAPQFKASFRSIWNGNDVSAVCDSETVYLMSNVCNAYLDFDSFDAVMERLNQIYGTHAVKTHSYSFYDASVSCDGKTFSLNTKDANIVLYKDCVVINAHDVTLVMSELYASDAYIKLTHPAKSECIDIDLLSQRLLSLREASCLSFEGVANYKDAVVNIDRLDMNLGELFELQALSTVFSLNNQSDLMYEIVYDGKYIYFDAENVKLYADAEPFLEPILMQYYLHSFARTSVRNSSYFGDIDSIVLQKDILVLKSANSVIEIFWQEDRLSRIDIVFDGFAAELRRIQYQPISIPLRDEFVDITDSGELVAKLFNTVEAGSFDFQGNVDIRFLSYTLENVVMEGTIDFSEEYVNGYIILEVPYIYGITSKNIDVFYGGAMLRECMIKSEIFIHGEKIYIKRTITVRYGESSTSKLMWVDKHFFSSDDVLDDPETLLLHVLNLDDDLLTNVPSVARYRTYDGQLFECFEKVEDQYAVGLNTLLIFPRADELVLYAETDETYVSVLGCFASISYFDIDLTCKLENHGRTEFTVPKQDFSYYLPLHE